MPHHTAILPYCHTARDGGSGSVTNGNDCGESYLAIQTPVDSSTVQYKLQNVTYTHSRLYGDENLSPMIYERHLLHSVVFLYASTG